MFGTLGGPELFLILVVALIVFGPRKLPEIGKSVGKMMAEFRKASQDFQRTIEEEVEAEKIREATRIEPATWTAPAASAPAALPPASTEPAPSEAPAAPAETAAATNAPEPATVGASGGETAAPAETVSRGALTTESK
jgi:Tat protein translocase TatB subunit